MKTTHVPARDTLDSGKVKLGGWGPSLPAQTAPANVKDAAKVRLGGWGPSLPVIKSMPASTPAAVKDAGKVHMGGWAPALPRKA